MRTVLKPLQATMTNIYAGNLDFSTSENELQILFAAYDASRILNGSVHGGRVLIVNEARPKLYRGGEHDSLPSRDHRRHRI